MKEEKFMDKEEMRTAIEDHLKKCQAMFTLLSTNVHGYHTENNEVLLADFNSAIEFNLETLYKLSGEQTKETETEDIPILVPF